VAALRSLGSADLVVVTGKGGVGKTTVAAALGEALATPGDDVLVLEVDPRESLHRHFEVPPSGGAPVAGPPGLWLWNLRPMAAVDRLLAERLPVPGLVSRVRASVAYQQFAAGCPGLAELCLLAAATDALAGKVEGLPRVRRVVLDAPATGHGLRLLEAPRLVAEVVTAGPFGRLAREAAEWLDAGARTRVVTVTLAEELPVTETLELHDELRAILGRAADLLVVNGIYPPFPGARAGRAARERKTRGRESRRGASWQLWQRRRAINERQLERLSDAWSGAAVELPLLAAEAGAAMRSRLSARLLALEGR
jgi:hypothetical protein